ncbi:P-loop containing nucleoside triphosphate hydrolase protein [Bisporella sp. PMI_857]|nr:P-loop containing nucleoside triphosphate hydrolase protein [Bisporella sp. PMI_857]
MQPAEVPRPVAKEARTKRRKEVSDTSVTTDSSSDSGSDNEDSSKDVKEKKKKKPSVPPGMEIGIKDLYREDPRVPWDDWCPDDIGLDIEDKPEAKKWALIVRREKSKAGKSTLALHSITVQSPLVKEFLGPVFEGYQGISTKLKELTFSSPFHEFFYRWDRFQTAIKDEKDELTLKHVDLLATVITAEIKPHLEKREDLLKHGLVTFDYIWALFEPDLDIWSEVDEQDRLYKLSSSKYQQSQTGVFFALSSRYIDTNGSSFGYVAVSLVIESFEGIKPVANLNVLPAHLHPHIEEIKMRLHQRGDKFRDLNGLHYKSYSGFCVMRKGIFGGPKKRNVDNGRIIIDGNTYASYNHDEMPHFQPLDAPTKTDNSNHIPFGDDSDSGDMPEFRIMRAVSRRMQRYAEKRSGRVDGSKKLNSTSLQDGNLIYCTPMLRGYCLTSKQWVLFYVGNVDEIKWNKDAFQRLVLPHDYKEIILAFVDSQLNKEDKFDDIVQGKGRGVIMLLSGEPGVGKTLTAESVAEEMKRPLYSMSAGELGLTADQVETSLQRVLEISTKWGAVLLLDECDVFLEQRTVSDIERNKLVSVFLRLLEYFKGVLFLTTNRISTFDAAFQSRIHLLINYPTLDFKSRMVIWHNFVRPEGVSSSKYSSSICDEDFESLAQMELNGREIKNIVKTAHLLASRKSVPLAMKHVRTVLKVKKGVAENGATLAVENGDGTCSHCGK